MLVTVLRISFESSHIVLTLFVRLVLFSILFENEELTLEFSLFYTEDTHTEHVFSNGIERHNISKFIILKETSCKSTPGSAC